VDALRLEAVDHRQGACRMPDRDQAQRGDIGGQPEDPADIPHPLLHRVDAHPDRAQPQRMRGQQQVFGSG
jgi:hypothetical protein